jgi:Flp pilus assembly protein TadD
MRRPILPVISAAIIFTLATLGLPYFHPDAFGTGGVQDETSNQKKGGGGIGGIFKAIARLFTGEKKKKPATDANKNGAATAQEARSNNGKPSVKRMTEKDAEAFETVVTAKVIQGPDPVCDTSPPSQTAKSNDLTAEQHLARGKALFNEGNNTAAITELSSAVAMNPQLKEAHRLNALAYARIGLASRSRDSYSKANQGNREDPQLLNDLGYALYLSGKYNQAVKLLKRAVQSDPDSKRFRNNLALAQFRLGKTDDAKKSFIAAGGDFDGHFNMGTLLSRTGKTEEAIGEFEAARRINPSDVVLKQLESLYEQTGRTEEARAIHKSNRVAGTVPPKGPSVNRE